MDAQETDRRLRAALDKRGVVKYRSPLWCEAHNSNERYVRGGRCVSCAKETSASYQRKKRAEVPPAPPTPKLPKSIVRQEQQEREVSQRALEEFYASAVQSEPSRLSHLEDARRTKVAENIYDFVRVESPHAVGFLAERIVRDSMGFAGRKHQSHDLFDVRTNRRIEVKAVRAQARDAGKNYTADCVLEYAVLGNARYLPEYSDFIHTNHTRGLAFGHVQKDKMDVLFLVVYFKDELLICEIDPKRPLEKGYWYDDASGKGVSKLIVPSQEVGPFFDSYTLKRLTYYEVASLLKMK